MLFSAPHRELGMGPERPIPFRERVVRAGGSEAGRPPTSLPYWSVRELSVLGKLASDAENVLLQVEEYWLQMGG